MYIECSVECTETMKISVYRIELIKTLICRNWVFFSEGKKCKLKC